MPLSTSVPAIEVQGVSRDFEGKLALDDVSLRVGSGEIHALLGPNGAGKTTLIRILSGLTAPTSGTIRVLGIDGAKAGRNLQRLIALIPSGDRTFYLRLSGLENLLFFGRLYGLTFRTAAARARMALNSVGLADAVDLQTARYSHGMQKRLAVARALLIQAPVLLVDEPTHNLDPEGAERVRGLIREAAGSGAAVVWTTQRVDEIRGFAETVTLLHRGKVRFSGTVTQLLAHAARRTYLLRVRNGQVPSSGLQAALTAALGDEGTITTTSGDPDGCVLSLPEGVTLGEALARLMAAGFQILACRDERPAIEQAFLQLTGEGS
ncbi:MAG TPA: ABC transporter ATP-binding protein [bacterium]|nr:ABC transporter ATP-binding protein [bacterium]